MLTAVERELATLLQYDPAYEWRGGNAALIASTDPEVIAEGPAETGKTYAACYKSHMACREYPGAQGAIVRKVAASIPGTVLLTMKRVIGKFPVTYFGGDNDPERIIYPNGSQIWLGGLDKPTKILSGERDFFQVCQSEELTVDDWEVMTTRATGRGAVMPYTQVYGDCNPSGSMHWIRTRAKAGSLRMIHTTHRDNPTLYASDGQLTDQGRKSMASLMALTGIRRKRLFEGIWATAEGAVYDGFDAAVHVVKRDPAEFRRFRLVMDEGYTNPAVILAIGEDADGRRHIFQEFYERGKLQGDVIAQAQKMGKQYSTRLCYVDEAAAGLIADLLNHGMAAQGAKGRVLDGIYAVQNALKVQGDGKPRLTVDPSCINVINEFESYEWKPQKDEPKKEHDHAMDAIRYDFAAELPEELPKQQATQTSKWLTEDNSGWAKRY